MNSGDIQIHIGALREYANSIKEGSGDIEEIQIKKKQLAAVQRTIRQLEKNRVPVPEGLSNEKLNLVSELNYLENASDGCIKVYESLLNIIFDLGRVCRRLPHKELYQLSKKWRNQATPQETLRQSIVTALKDMEGTGKEAKVFESIEKQLSSHFTPADLSRPGGKNLRWQNNVRRERKRMIKEGILTKDSKGKTWTLTK